MSKWAPSWGAWHTGPEAHQPCPQDGQWHTVQEAVTLNSKDAEYRQAVAWARHKTWIGDGR